MGRCQGGFCSPKVVAILSRELGVPMEEIRKSDQDSVMLYGDTEVEVTDSLKVMERQGFIMNIEKK